MSQERENASAIFAALDRGESLPAAWYTDARITEREVQEIFRKSWNYIGPAKELANVGDYITGYAGMVPVVVIRNEEGLAGFVNVCRHRRHEVMKGRGNAKVMTCGYHAWAYDMKGCLKRAPRSAAEKNFRLEDYPLLPIRAEALGPFVFVNGDWDAPPVTTYYAGLMDIIAQSGIKLDTLELYSRSDWEAPANWKTMLENYLECYHCPVAHPGFSSAIDVAPENYSLTAHGWYMSQTGYVRESALQGKTAVKIYDARGELKMAQYHVLFPNFTININPGFTNMSVDVWRPKGPNACEGFSEQYFGPGVSEAFANELIEFNTQVGIEDDDLTNSVQRGLIGGIPERGRTLTNSEHLVVHFQRLVANALTRSTDAERSPAEKVIPIIASINVNPTESVLPEAEKNAHVQLAILKVEKESDVISSFYLQRVDGAKLAAWEPGQFLPIRVNVPGEAAPAQRTYTLSTCANPNHYRLSIRRLDPAVVSKFLHDHGKPGTRIEAMAPRGKFVLDQSSDRPAVLVSGGVGITPMIAMAEHIVAEGRRTKKFRPIYFVHGCRNGAEHAFSKHVREIASEHPQMHVHYVYSKPGKSDKFGTTHQSEGHVTIDTLKRILPFGDYDFYLCGPAEFMSSLYAGLTAMNVAPERIHYESFGPGSVLKPVIHHKAPAADGDAGGIARVRFAKSGIDAVWSRDMGNLLELAEEAGIAAAFGCRSGVCGTCKTTIRSGAVDYIEEPLVERAANEVLLCCSLPKRAPGHRADSHEPDVVLEI